MSDDYMHHAWQLKMIKEAERKLKEGRVGRQSHFKPAEISLSWDYFGSDNPH